MADENRPSGGKRAVERKHAARDAERTREAESGDWRADWKAKVAELGPRPGNAEGAFTWLGRAAVLIVEATLRDTAVPFEQMRRDAMKQIEQAAKILDPAKLSEQLAELEHALQELHDHASDVETGEDRPPTPPAALA